MTQNINIINFTSWLDTVPVALRAETNGSELWSFIWIHYTLQSFVTMEINMLH